MSQIPGLFGVGASATGRERVRHQQGPYYSQFVFEQLTPRRRPGLGDAAAFGKALVDLGTVMGVKISQGDFDMANSDPNSAIASYQAAGAAGVMTIGPEIDGAGASNVTQPSTQQAWLLNATLQAINPQSGTVAAATQAGTTVKAMLGLYAKAINDGLVSLGGQPQPPPPGYQVCPDGSVIQVGNLCPVKPPPPPPPPNPPTPPTPTQASATNYTVPIVLGAAAVGVGIIAWAAFSKPSRRAVAEARRHR